MQEQVPNSAIPSIPTAQHVVDRVSQAVFGKTLVTNVFRGHLVEAMLSMVLAPDWKWTSEDYASWDFENTAGVRLELKQSARKQSWANPSGSASKPSFDIAPRSIHWIAGKPVAANARAAAIYIFAFHPIDDATCDHRDPMQWQFFVVPTRKLPNTKRVSLRQVQLLAAPVDISRLGIVLNQHADALQIASNGQPG